MRLNALLEAAGLPRVDRADPELTGIALDSRLVQPGFVFVAVRGVPLPSRLPLDGHEFVGSALERGAVAVVGTREHLEASVPYVRVSDDRAAVADLARAFWDDPGSRLRLIGVTGSKGKTTVTTLVHHLLETADPPSGRLSTVGARWAGQDALLPGHFTTPEAPQVQELLARFVAAGCRTAAIEVSSHALALERVRGLQFEVGVWTNLEPEHLDFHETLDAYAAEKRKLLERSVFGVLNREDPAYPQLPGMDHWSYGRGADWACTELREGPAGLDLVCRTPLGPLEARVPLLGSFNALNSLAAMAAAARLGLDRDALARGLASFPGVPGRMQLVQARPVRVIVDFAHTGASLRAALSTLRATAEGRLIVVVGAAGERDPNRRPALARAAARLADLAVFTEEDHRSENLDQILAMMAAASAEAGGTHLVVPDRRDAIRRALREAQPGDTVLLAGKGHERTLERDTETLAWDELEEARAALAAS